MAAAGSLALLVACNLALLLPAEAVEIYVSAPTAGLSSSAQEESSADGSQSRPFRSVHAAQAAMRAGLGEGQPRTVHVEGTHFLERPLVLDARDAATHDAPVTWQSRSKDAPAHLTGGKQVPTSAFGAATVPSGANGVVKANLFTALGLSSADLGGMTNPYPFADMELYVDGQPMTRARSPNIVQDGTSHGHWMWAGYSNVTGVTDMTFDFADSTMAELWAPATKSDTGLWLHGFFKFDWRDTFIKIDSIAPNANHSYTVTRSPLTPPQYPFTNGCRFYAVAALELLDVPGEYHINNKTGDLHFLPLKPMTSETNVMVSVLNTVVEAGADHHSFKDMTISVARAGPAFTTVANGTTVGTHVTVENCTVSNSGGGCLALQGNFNTAKGNAVFGCGSSGISVIAGDVNTLSPGNASVVGNNMTQVARIQRTYAPGVAFSGVGNYVANNTVSDVPHTAITGGGNDWMFEYNTITHACYETIDTGAFYIGRSWSQRGNVARYNVFDTVRPTEKLAQTSCSQNAFVRSSLSLSHTHTHTLTHSLTYSLTHSLTLWTVPR